MQTDRSSAVRLRLFARYAELLGTSELELSMPLPASVEAIVARLKAEHAGAASIPDRPLAAVNLRHVNSDHMVHAGDELSLLPPVAGG